MLLRLKVAVYDIEIAPPIVPKHCPDHSLHVLIVPYVWTILGSHFCRGVRKHHSSLLPRPRSTEHSSLQATIPHSSSFQCLLFKHQASLFCACSNVSNGRRLHFQLVMP